MSRPTISHKILLTIFICLMVLLVVACGEASPQINDGKSPTAPAKDQTLRYPIGSIDFGSLDPALAYQTIDSYTVRMIYTGLISIQDNGMVIDQLASSHHISSDGLTYTFVLKPNLKFSDGTSLTAQDIVYSIDRALSPATKSPTASFLEPMKDWNKMVTGKVKTLIGDSLFAKDDHTVVIVLDHPAAYFLTTFAMDTTLTVNRKLIEKYGSKWTDHLQEGAETGPFMVQNYDHNLGLTLVPNPYYSGPKPQLQKIEMLRSGSTDASFKTYQTGRLDYSEVPPIQLLKVKGQKDYRSIPALAIAYVTMNYLARPFDNIKIRQAFALAINKDLIAQNVLHNSALATNHLVPAGMPGYNAALVGPDGSASTRGNVAKAKQLLQEGMQEAGYSSVSQLPPIKLTYAADSEVNASVAAVLMQQWQTILGITIKTDVISDNILTQKILDSTGNAGPLQIWFTELGNYADPQGWLSFDFGKGASFNNMNYGQNKSSTATAQQAVQDELQKADINLDFTARMQQYNDAEQKLVNDVAWLPLYQEKYHTVINPKLHNFPLNPSGIVAPDDWSKVYFGQ
ncbi:peptide ABC transporter substrate-binding protein [Ktedonosporobacter rubrisoli]|uniref:Peptide ABC transporter substrate-binding protein n=1 Tax=Ktedonosporobacter rubrisoli TaxID=2509675 RepID=A0A4P6JKG3_KTERU|nr:peptide ABC transporter substrate-binding protein [Ktedonosporobacter rubrisoli]QBD75462.1 peptide ABC transporter substrate-binding protein [Ktedonosporobacter rubrisoli]